jgi:hypothetical protein
MKSTVIVEKGVVTNVLLLQEQYDVSGDRGYLGAVMLRVTLVEDLKDEEKVHWEWLRGEGRQGSTWNKAEKPSGQSKDCLRISGVLYTVGTGRYISDSGLVNLTISRRGMIDCTIMSVRRIL